MYLKLTDNSEKNAQKLFCYLKRSSGVYILLLLSLKISGMGRVATQSVHSIRSGSFGYPTANVSVMVVGDSLDAVDAFNKYPQLTEVQVLGQERNWKEIVKLYKLFNPDVVLLDTKKSTSDDFMALGKIRKINPHTKIVDVSADQLL